jgi:hypothetical protein
MAPRNVINIYLYKYQYLIRYNGGETGSKISVSVWAGFWAGNVRVYLNYNL